MSSERVSPRTRSTPRTAGRFLLSAFPRVMGAVTVGYAVVVLARPETMTAAIGLSEGAPDPDLALLTRTMLVRDLACGAAMMLVPAGWPLLTAIGIRVASDAGDAAIMGTGLPTGDDRTAALLVAGGFGVLCALSALGARAPELTGTRS
ncbi:hypothetical protein IDM40_18250 [Nocardiopsis sp. HNM0947]|uniref:Uncharacterized protein n=1 Tax=Nocardiopsis coralli TaxID=2772213 RepID=A0ABR9P9W3_9ACTN|nr:hypothetical protein [Nocardiopsis coralli]MBE3000627.1 hypothetical protein [Nocardiopsis coralli]